MITHCDPAELPEASLNDHPADRLVEAFCPRCNASVNATCPECSGHVEAVGSDPGAAGVSSYTRLEFYRRLILLVQNSRNSKFTLGCYLIATGDAFADGISMTEYARTWSVKKATVSKHCRLICRYLGIPPSQYMRREETARKFRLANRRPTKMKG